MMGIWNKHSTLLKTGTQDFPPRTPELRTRPRDIIYTQKASIQTCYGLEMDVPRILAMLCCFWENHSLPELDVNVYRTWTHAWHSEVINQGRSPW